MKFKIDCGEEEEPEIKINLTTTEGADSVFLHIDGYTILKITNRGTLQRWLTGPRARDHLSEIGFQIDELNRVKEI
jgi:hypothetical protein